MVRGITHLSDNFFRNGKFGSEVTIVNHTEQACSTLYVVRATSAKFVLHAGNMALNTQTED
jgi:hypothetical protein